MTTGYPKLVVKKTGTSMTLECWTCHGLYAHIHINFLLNHPKQTKILLNQIE